jgi:hypothetical protein
VADAAPDGDVEGDPLHWPAWTDYHRYAPSPDDRAWWAGEIERLESARIDRDADLRAAESDALDALTRGLIPPTWPLPFLGRIPMMRSKLYPNAGDSRTRSPPPPATGRRGRRSNGPRSGGSRAGARPRSSA